YDPDEVPASLNPMPTLAPGFLRRAEAAKRYGERSGRPLDALDYYLVFGTFKMAVVLQQIYFRYHRGQTRDARFAGMGEAAKALCRHADARRSQPPCNPLRAPRRSLTLPPARASLVRHGGFCTRSAAPLPLPLRLRAVGAPARPRGQQGR